MFDGTLTLIRTRRENQRPFIDSYRRLRKIGIGIRVREGKKQCSLDLNQVTSGSKVS